MTNVEKVLKALEGTDYTITQYPCKAYIEINEIGYKRFYGSVIGFNYKTPFVNKDYELFINDEEDSSQFHNGFSLLGNINLPDVLWFKEYLDIIIKDEGFYILGLNMEKHQKEYIKLLDEKFKVVGKPRRAFYSYGKIPDRGILVELESPHFTRVFISDGPRSYYHKFASELKSEHLPNCVWIISKSDSDLSLNKEFFI